MATAHGAGLMLLPVFTGMRESSGARAVTDGLSIALVHTLAMFTVAGTIAVLVYEVAGLSVLRRAWFNVDRMWAAALVGVGVLTLVRV